LIDRKTENLESYNNHEEIIEKSSPPKIEIPSRISEVTENSKNNFESTENMNNINQLISSNLTHEETVKSVPPNLSTNSVPNFSFPEKNPLNTTELPLTISSSGIIYNNKKIENSSDEQKIALNIILTNQHVSILKKIPGNIYIELENKYGCSISKKNEVKIFLFRNRN
jgi:hypothetical protein